MFFNKATKQAFIFPPKTGTISVRHFLGSIGWHGLRPYHLTVDEWIEKYSALNDYKIYGFCRNPLERFESAILHCKQVRYLQDDFQKLLQRSGISESVEVVSYETLTNIHASLVEEFKGLFLPQTRWLNHPKVTVLNFRNMEAELRRITGNTEQPLVRYNTSTDFGRSVITPAVEEFVRQQYADDYRLFDTLNGA